MERKKASELYSPILMQALDSEGRYDAVKLAALLDWSDQDIAYYLRRDLSTIPLYGASPQAQHLLSQLAALLNAVLRLLDGNIAAARAWLRTPVSALGESPKEKILHHDLEAVGSLLEEVESGFAA